jgi:hypothetical protein
MNLIEKHIMDISKGNIGVLQVLIEIAKDDVIFLNKLWLAIFLTDSEGYGIWLVYKDMCKHDIEKTKVALEEWFDNSSQPLESYLEQRGIR